VLSPAPPGSQAKATVLSPNGAKLRSIWAKNIPNGPYPALNTYLDTHYFGDRTLVLVNDLISGRHTLAVNSPCRVKAVSPTEAAPAQPDAERRTVVPYSLPISGDFAPSPDLGTR
jgi:hypothetical protein